MKWLIALRLDTSIASLSARQNSLCNSKCVSLILMILSSGNSMLSLRSMYRFGNSFSVREVLKLLHGELLVLAEALYDKLAITPGSILHLRPYITPIVFLTGFQQERPQDTVNCECFRLFFGTLCFNGIASTFGTCPSLVLDTLWVPSTFSQIRVDPCRTSISAFETAASLVMVQTLC